MNKKCQVFTPENYVKELLDSVGYTRDLYGRKILENSCGDGNILVAIVQRYIDDCRNNGLSNDRIRRGLADDIFGAEIDKVQHRRCINNLNRLLKNNGIAAIEWNITNEDYLKKNFDSKFQYIVGNPPYITYRDLKEAEREYVKKNFVSCSKGKFDYCYAFIEKSIKDLSDDGQMSYLIPSSIFKTVFGKNLRNSMSLYVESIKDYTRVKIFDKALVKSSIIVLSKQRKLNNTFTYTDMSLERQIEVPINQLGEKWVFSAHNQQGEQRFGDYFKVSHVVATLLNRAFVLSDGSYEDTEAGYIVNNHLLERALVRDTETPRTLRHDKHEKIIFPYAYDEQRLVRFDEEEFNKLYPGVSGYLEEFREGLDNRQSDNTARWYEYGRSQGLIGLNREKLLISTVVTNDIEVYWLNQECIPYAGMYIVEREDNNEYTLEDAIRFLQTDEFKEYVFGIGIPINGKSVRITSKDIENYTF